jgi:CheY-like chemotaxis protein
MEQADIATHSSGTGSNDASLVLIVEDDPVNSLFLQLALRNSHLKLIIASTGTQAIELFDKNPGIKLILLDIKLPDISGYDLSKYFKEKRKYVAIIAQTAYALPGDREKVLDSGCDDYISKPIKKEYLLQLVDRYINS